MSRRPGPRLDELFFDNARFSQAKNFQKRLENGSSWNGAGKGFGVEHSSQAERGWLPRDAVAVQNSRGGVTGEARALPKLDLTPS